MKKRIAIVHDRLNVGGTEKVLISLLKYLDYTKYEVTLWLSDVSGPLQSEIDKRVIVIEYSNESIKTAALVKKYLKEREFARIIPAVISKTKSRQNIKHFYKNLVYDILSLPYLDQMEYDAVIVYQGLYPSLLATALGRIKSKKKIAWIHMYFKHDDNSIELFSSFYRKMDKIFCVSKDIKRHYDEVYGSVNNKSQVFYNILNYEEMFEKSNEPIHIDENMPFLLTVGRLSPEKGTIQIPSIAKRLKNDGFCFKWLILGDGQERKKIEDLIAEYSLQNNVILLGNVLNPYPYYKNCWLYVQPSFSEGYCTSTLEAKSFGKLVVTTNVSGMNEQFTNGEDGIICDKSENALYESIKSLFEN